MLYMLNAATFALLSVTLKLDNKVLQFACRMLLIALAVISSVNGAEQLLKEVVNVCT